MKKHLFLSFVFVFTLAYPRAQAQTLLTEIESNDFRFNLVVKPVFTKDASGAYYLYVANGNKIEMYHLASGIVKPTNDTGTDSHKKDISELTSDAEVIASLDWDNTIKIWTGSLTPLAIIQENSAESWISAVALSPTNSVLAYARYSKNSESTLIKFYNYVAKKEEAVFKNPTKESLSGLAYSPDGKYLFSYSDERLTVWEVATGNIVDTVEGRYIAYVGYVATTKSYIVKSGKKLYKRSLKGGVELIFNSLLNENISASFVVSPNEKYLYAADGKSFMKWDIATGNELKTIEYNGIFIPHHSLLSADAKVASIIRNGEIHLIKLDW